MKKNLLGKAKAALIIIIVIVIAIVGIAAGFIVGRNSKNSGTKTAETQTASQTESETEKESESDESKAETESETETKHVSPTQSVTSELGYQIEVKQSLDHDKNKTYKASLADFGIRDGDKINSFTFIFSSDQTMDSYQGGWGVSVSDDCPSKTDDGWYQSEDFTQNVNGKYAEIKVDVPSDVADYIDPKGQVLIGFWWSSASSVSLDYIIADDTRTEELPVDVTYQYDVNKDLDYSSDSAKTAKVNLSDKIKNDEIPQSVTYKISAGSGFGKFTGAFGISLKSGAPESTSDGYYQTVDIAEITDSNSLELTWIIPENLREYVDVSGTVDLGYWYSEQQNITLQSISINCAYGDIIPDNAESNNQDATSETKAQNNKSQGSMKSAKDIVSDIKVGWNLGNTFDSKNDSQSKKTDETSWGNPKTTKAMIDSVKSAGFNAIRIPVTWYNHMDSSYKIDSAWMSRVKEVVDWAYDDGLYIIINTHHDEDWIDVNSTSSSSAIKTIWEQIGNEFKDYDYHLIFEGMNELRTVGSANEWNGGTSAERQNVNAYWQVFVDTVRAQGGNNASRALIVSTYGQSINGDAVRELKVPSDSNIIVSIHSYAPYNFAQNAQSDDKDFGSAEDKKEIDDGFNLLKSTFVDKGIPVIMDEFGDIDKNNEDERAKHFEYFISAAKQRGIKVFIWDNGIFNTGSSDNAFAIFDRKKLSWNQTILNAIMNGAK